MRPAFACIAAFLFIGIATAAEPALLGSFISRSFEPDMVVSARALLADGSYYVISADGVETYALDASSGKAVSDSAGLVSILEQDVYKSEGFEGMVSSALNFSDQVNDAKKAGEGKCLQYIGDDGDPGCTDRQSCLVSCFSVPQCDLIVHADGFLESAMEWDFKRKEFSEAIGDFSDGLSSIRSDPAAIDAKVAILSPLPALASNMSQNPIFLTKDDLGCSGRNATLRCYEYCPKIDYSPSKIQLQLQNLASLKAALQKINAQRPRAALILAKSAANDLYLSTRGRDTEEFRLRMANDIRNLKNAKSELAANVSDPSLALSIARLENISAQAKNYSDEGYYRQALELRAEFVELSNGTSDSIRYDAAQYASFVNGMDLFFSKVKQSEWLIGNSSSAAYYANLSSLKSSYPAPLSPAKITKAKTELFDLSVSLDAEIALKAVQAGNNTSLPPPLPPRPANSSLPCLPAFVVLLALCFASAGRRRF
jgi:hypothetical protein